MTFIPLAYAFIFIPGLELLFSPDNSNLSEEIEKKFLANPIFDYILYFMVLVQTILLLVFLFQIGEQGISNTTVAGRILAMGLCCGVIGINVAHELGHRLKLYERNLGKILLLTSLYMQFYIEHNRGHHKHIGTMADANTARRNESIYTFYWRSISSTYVNAWKLEFKRLAAIGKSKFSIQNQMLQFQLLMLALPAAILISFDVRVMFFFLCAALFGIILLESVNYIEHYGLLRNKTVKGHYERTMPAHSWNSNHKVGRIMLFELSRHSDHHFISSKKYQILQHHDDSPQMPTGYPGMILLALLPPLWMRLMNKRIDRYKIEGFSQA